ncbi:MAG: HEAT repeat domain-containing protein [Asgard group archaeon]|nr:HEAT repeat domain-containing protein [Asgard group archaeon]
MNVTKKIKKQILNLESENISERNEAVSSLTEDMNEELAYLLISLLEQNTSRLFREGACKILGEIKSDKAVDVLINCLKDNHDGVRYYATKALGKIKNEKAVIPLIEKLRTAKDPSQRAEIVTALGIIGDKRAVKSIIRILQNDRDQFVRQQAVLALGKIGDENALRALHKIAEKKGTSEFYLTVSNVIQEINKKNKK